MPADNTDPLGDFIATLPATTPVDTGTTSGTDDYGFGTDGTDTGDSGADMDQPGWFDSIFGGDAKKYWDALKGFLPGGGRGPTAGQGIAGALALAKLLGRKEDRPLAGYQGGIPEFTASRDQYPRPTTATGSDDAQLYSQYQQGIAAGRAPADILAAGTNNLGLSNERMNAIVANQGGGRRAGSGGVRYFSPMTYTKTPPAAAAPPADPSLTMPVGDGGTVPVIPEPPSRPINSIEDPANTSAGMAAGGLASLRSRFLQGPGDGTSDGIQARMAGGGQARLADGEFVIDARTVSELGNGSSAAGAEELYKMIERVQQMRKRAQRGKPSGAKGALPA